MKKNTMMRVASVLLIAVLLTTSAISGTFAKYVTQNDGSDSARVAKWGVIITAGGTLFGENYATGTQSVPTTNTTTSQLSVQTYDFANVAQNIVAPGTKSENGISFSLNGTPEVRTQVDVIVTAQDIYLAAGTYGTMRPVVVTAIDFATKVGAGIYTLTGSAYTKVASGDAFDTGTVYYEIADQVTVASGGYYPVAYANTNNDANDTKITEIARKIAANIQGTLTDDDNTTAGVRYTVTKTVDPNTNLGTDMMIAANTLSWEWTFYSDATADQEDTILGNLAANSPVVQVGDAGAVTVLSVDPDTGIVTAGTAEVGSIKTGFSVDITATQVD